MPLRRVQDVVVVVVVVGIVERRLDMSAADVVVAAAVAVAVLEYNRGRSQNAPTVVEARSQNWGLMNTIIPTFCFARQLWNAVILHLASLPSSDCSLLRFLCSFTVRTLFQAQATKHRRLERLTFAYISPSSIAANSI